MSGRIKMEWRRLEKDRKGGKIIVGERLRRRKKYWRVGEKDWRRGKRRKGIRKMERQYEGDRNWIEKEGRGNGGGEGLRNRINIGRMGRNSDFEIQS